MSNQPKWAWWVVGIVIPVTGIVVSIQLATKSDSGDDQQTAKSPVPAAVAPGGGESATAGGTGGSGGSGAGTTPAAGAPAKVLADSVRITLSEDASYVDLDSRTPVPQPSGKGIDATVGFLLPDLTLGPPRSGNVVAVMPSEGPEPTRDECDQAIAKRGTYTSGELALGMRLCVQTDEGRTAYVKVMTVPTRKSVTLQATVWE